MQHTTPCQAKSTLGHKQCLIRFAIHQLLSKTMDIASTNTIVCGDNKKKGKATPSLPYSRAPTDYMHIENSQLWAYVGCLEVVVFNVPGYPWPVLDITPWSPH